MPRCADCGGTFVASSDPIDVSVRGEAVCVHGIEHVVCDTCGNWVCQIDDMDRLQMAAHDIYRKRHGYLSGKDIRAIRSRYGATQEDFEYIIGAGAKTLTRWESEKVMQPGVANVLLRVLERFPIVFSWLKNSESMTFNDLPVLSDEPEVSIDSSVSHRAELSARHQEAYEGVAA